MWCAAYRSAAAVFPRASAAGRAAVAAALTSTWHQRTFLSNAAATEAAAADNSDHHGDVGLAPRSIPVNLRPAPEEGGPHKRDPLQKKIDELKSALLADYKDQPLTARQEQEWSNVVDALEELVKIDQIVVEEQLEEEGDAQDDGDNEELTIALGDDNEFLGEVMDHSPVTSPYEEAPILEIHSDAWAFERPEFSQLNTLQLQEHAKALRSRFTSVKEGSADVLRFESRQYFYLNPTGSMPIKEAKVAVKFYTGDLGLAEAAESKLVELVGPRYNPATGEVKLVSGRYPSTEMNKEYLKIILARLVREAKK
eukprot:gene8606-6339_t